MTRYVVAMATLVPLLVSAGTSIYLVPGWNLVGNSDSMPIQVAGSLSDKTRITSVWKWNKNTNKWAFYSPLISDSTALAAYASGKSYDVLAQIDPKEGFWVNASAVAAITGDPMAVPPEPGSAAAALVGTDLANGWNLVASADNKNPSQINTNLSTELSTYGKAMVTAWGWDATTSSWKFFAPSLEAQGASALSNYIAGKTYRNFAVAPASTDGFWVNVAASSGGGGTSQTPLEAAKAFIGTLRSNAMALNATDLSLQTELQAASTDLKNRMMPVVDSNLDGMNLAWLGLQFWNEVMNNPNAPFVPGKTFYDTSNPFLFSPKPIGGCTLYSYISIDLFTVATSKLDAKYVGCSTPETMMSINYIAPTDVNGLPTSCSVAGDWCGTYWSTRVRLAPDAADINKFAMYTQTRESRRLISAPGYFYYDSALGNTVAGLATCPAGITCQYGTPQIAVKTNYGATFPGNAASLTTTRDLAGKINSVSLTGELAPGFAIQRSPAWVYDPVNMMWLYRQNSVAVVLGDKHNVALTASLSQSSGVDKVAFSGTMNLIKNGVNETDIELGVGSYVLARPNDFGIPGFPVSYTARDGSQEMLLKLKGGSSLSRFSGDVKVAAFQSDASGTTYLPTQVTFAGSVQRNGVSFFDGTIAAELLNQETFNAQMANSSINVQAERVGVVGNVVIPNRPVINVILGMTSKLAGGLADSALLSGQYAQGTSIVNVSGSGSGMYKVITLESPNGVKLVLDKSQLIQPITYRGTLVGEYSTATKMVTYIDNTYEQF